MNELEETPAKEFANLDILFDFLIFDEFFEDGLLLLFLRHSVAVVVDWIVNYFSHLECDGKDGGLVSVFQTVVLAWYLLGSTLAWCPSRLLCRSDLCAVHLSS